MATGYAMFAGFCAAASSISGKFAFSPEHRSDDYLVRLPKKVETQLLTVHRRGAQLLCARVRCDVVESHARALALLLHSSGLNLNFA